MPMFMFVPRLDARVRRTQSRPIDCFELDTETTDAKQRQLFAQEVRINTRGHCGAEYHVATRAGETVEVKSLHCPINGRTSPALPISTSSHKPDSGVRSGLTSQTYA